MVKFIVDQGDRDILCYKRRYADKCVSNWREVGQEVDYSSSNLVTLLFSARYETRRNAALRCNREVIKPHRATQNVSRILSICNVKYRFQGRK